MHTLNIPGNYSVFLATSPWPDLLIELVIKYWYAPLSCYCAVGGILDNVTAAAQLAGY